MRIREISKILKRNPFFEIYVCVYVPYSTEFSPYAGKLTFFKIHSFTDKLHNMDEEKYNKLKNDFEKQRKKLE